MTRHEHEKWQLLEHADGGQYCGACGERVGVYGWRDWRNGTVGGPVVVHDDIGTFTCTTRERLEWARRNWSIGGSMCVWACRLCDYRGASRTPVPYITEHLAKVHAL